MSKVVAYARAQKILRSLLKKATDKNTVELRKPGENNRLFWCLPGKTIVNFGAYSLIRFTDDNEVIVCILPKTEKAYQNWLIIGNAMNQNENGIQMTFPEEFQDDPQWANEYLRLHNLYGSIQGHILYPDNLTPPPGFPVILVESN